MDISLLKDKNFFLLMQGQLASLLGSAMQTFALSLYVLNHYNSTTLFASVLIIAALPRLFLGPFVSVFADWFDRKKIIVRLDFLSGIVVLLVATYFFINGVLPMWLIYTLTVTLSLISLLFNPAIVTVIPNIVSEEKLFNANAINSFVVTSAQIASPIIAGILMGYTGIGVVLAINGISFMVSSITEMFIEIPATHKMPEKITMKVFKDDLMEGVRFIRDDKFLFNLILMAMVLNFAMAPVFSVGIPHLLKKVLLVTDIEFGLFECILMVGSLVGAVAAGWVSKKLTMKQILFLSFATQPLVVGVIALISSDYFIGLFSSYYGPFVSLIAVGFAMIVVISFGNIAVNTYFQKQVPKHAMGRIATVMSTGCMAAMPLGQGIMGALLDIVPPWMPIAFFGIVLLWALQIVVTKVFPSIDEAKKAGPTDTAEVV